MKHMLKSGFLLLLTLLTLAACASYNPYGSPDDQRSRSKDAQDEMRRDTSR